MGSIYNTIINPIAWVFGKILDFLFMGLHAIGLGNIAIAIIVFTFLVKILMLPLTVKQSKMMKLNNIIMPEVRKIQDKYKDKRNDQEAMLKMQAETKAVYEKYGTSQMGGCIQMLIQFPILMAMYRVIQYIPMYVGQLKNLFVNILTGTDGGIMNVSGYADIMAENFKMTGRMTNVDWGNIDSAVTAMNSFSADQWETLKSLFPAYAGVIAENQTKITFLDVGQGDCAVIQQKNEVYLIDGGSIAVLIPILSGLSQYISVKVSQGNTQMDPDDPTAASMKMMTLFMPIMSAFIAFSVPAGLGVYWIATAVFQTILQVLVNRHYDKMGVDAIVAKNVERMNKKRAKKGLPPEKIAKNAVTNTKKLDSIEKSRQRVETLQAKKEANDKKMKEILSSTEYYKSAKPGSLAEKAGMVARYNEKNTKNTKK